MTTHIETELHHLGAYVDFQTEMPKRIDVAKRRLCVIQHEGTLYALDDLCTHGQAFLSEGEFVPEECAVECPLHGGLFNIKTGQACGEPATRPVRIYKTVIRKGEAYVNLE